MCVCACVWLCFNLPIVAKCATPAECDPEGMSSGVTPACALVVPLGAEVLADDADVMPAIGEPKMDLVR